MSDLRHETRQQMEQFELKMEYFERKLKNWKALQKDNTIRVKKFSEAMVSLELRMKDML